MISSSTTTSPYHPESYDSEAGSSTTSKNCPEVWMQDGHQPGIWDISSILLSSAWHCSIPLSFRKRNAVTGRLFPWTAASATSSQGFGSCSGVQFQILDTELVYFLSTMMVGFSHYVFSCIQLIEEMNAAPSGIWKSFQDEPYWCRSKVSSMISWLIYFDFPFKQEGNVF